MNLPIQKVSTILEIISFFLVTIDLYGAERLNFLRITCKSKLSAIQKANIISSKIVRKLLFVMIVLCLVILIFLGWKYFSA